VRLIGITRPGDIAYDADDNIERGLNPSESIPDSDVLFGSEIRGLGARFTRSDILDAVTKPH
jgi:hypothetical protein